MLAFVPGVLLPFLARAPLLATAGPARGRGGRPAGRPTCPSAHSGALRVALPLPLPVCPSPRVSRERARKRASERAPLSSEKAGRGRKGWAGTRAMDEKAQRVKDLLASYYGADDEATGGSDATADATGRTGTGGGASAAEANSGKGSSPRLAARSPAPSAGLDSAAFDDERYLSSLLQKTRLDGLLSKHSEMVSEIQTLDGDMQMLVYDNYERFIAATDTIKRMRSNVEGMEGQMDKLLEGMERVADVSGEVNDRLSVHREEVERLHGVGGLLRKIRVVQELPGRLRKCLAHDALAIAARWYLDAKPVLERYGSTSFARVAKDTEQVVAEVRAKMQDQLAADTLDAGDAAEYMELLQAMGQPVQALRSEYVSSRESKLRACLDRASQRKRDMLLARAAGGGGEGTAEADAGSLQAFVAATNTDLLSELAGTASSFRSLFPDDAEQLVAAVQAPADEYLALVRSVLPPTPGAPSWSADQLVAALGTLATDMGRVGAIAPGARLHERALELAHAAIEGAAGAVGAEAVASVARAMTAAKEDLAGVLASGDVEAAAKAICSARDELRAAVMASAEEAIAGMADLSRSASAARELTGGVLPTLHAAMQREMSALVLGVLDRLAGVGAKDEESTPVPAIRLLGWAVLGVLEDEVVPKLMDAISEHAAEPDLTAGRRPPFVAGELIRGVGAAKSLALRTYAESRGRVLSSMVRKSIATPDWFNMKEPRAPRLYVEMMTKELDELARESTALLPPGDAGRSVAGQVPSQGETSMVDRLFREKVKVFADVEPTCASVQAAVIGIALRSLRECVREVTLGGAGYRQMQVDIAALRASLATRTQGDAALAFALDEALKAAEERATDNAGLDDDVIAGILESAAGGRSA